MHDPEIEKHPAVILIPSAAVEVAEFDVKLKAFALMPFVKVEVAVVVEIER